MKKLLLFIAILIFCAPIIYSQHTILFLDGGEGDIRNYKYNEEGTSVTYHVANDKNETSGFAREVIEIDLADIFSITSPEGVETIIYKPDTLNGNLFNVEEMRSFIKGEQVCREQYDTKKFIVGGAVLGVTSVFLTPFVAPFYFAPIPSLLGTVGANMMTEKKDAIVKKNPDFINDEHFILGYQDASSNINLRKTMFGSGVGLVVGYIVYFVIKGAIQK